MGWALKKHKSTRFSTAVKAYLNEKFLIGKETGNKASPTQVAREMRRERDDTGNRLFVGADCLSSQHIAAYFSRLAATKTKHGSSNAPASSEEVEEILAEQQMQEHEEDISRRKKVGGIRQTAVTASHHLQVLQPLQVSCRREINKEI